MAFALPNAFLASASAVRALRLTVAFAARAYRITEMPPPLFDDEANVAIDAMKSGRPVMTEKPMARTVADARKMNEAAEKTGKLLPKRTRERYEQGAADITELLTAEVGLSSTRMHDAAAYYDYLTALANLDGEPIKTPVTPGYTVRG